MSWPVMFVLLALVALAGVLLLYRRWEPRGRGRLLLGALRWAASVLILLLLFDPLVPRRDAATGRTRVLLDGSLSMGMPGDSGRTAWQQAVARAREQGVPDVLVFGVDPSVTSSSALGAKPPGASMSLLAPALRIAAEEGARRVLVLSDGRIGDAAEAQKLARGMSVGLETVRVGGGGVDYGLVELDAPAWAEAGEPLEVRVGIAGSQQGTADTTLSVVLKADGRVVAGDSVAAPAEGRVASLTLRFTPETGGRLVRLEAVLSGGDVVPDDDRRVAYVRVASRPAAVLVSLHPDWEPRFLAPALQRALGLPVQGFLHVGGTRYLRLGAGPSAGEPVSSATVMRSVQDADLLVLHGMNAAAPAWLGRAAMRARRLVVLPDTGIYGDSPVPLSAPAGGEWYLSADVPASPVAPLLNGLSVEDLPPLAGLRLLRLPRGWWTPLVLRRGRRGVDAPMMAAGEVAGRRVVVVTATGTWRWAFTGGNEDTYDRVWSAMVGWLMGGERVPEVSVRPAPRVAARGAVLRWVAPGLRPDSVALVIGNVSGTVMDTVVSFVSDSATTRPLPAGDYAYRARALRRDSVVATASGPFSVASFSPDFTTPVASLRVTAAGDVARPGSRVPLRAMVWPYGLLLVVLVAEWTLRRRWGLR